MSNYSQTTNFTAKDALASGNPLKLIRGSEFDTEFSAISTAIATKFETSDVDNWSDQNAGIVGDLHDLADPGADRVFGWDESANAAIAFTVSGALAFSGTDLSVSAANLLTQLLTVDGSGSGLDADLLDGQSSAYYLSASNLNAGTLPDARFPATLPAASGANLTALNGSQVTSGTVPVANGGTGVTTQAAITRAVTLAWTIQSDPGGTPSGSPGDVFAYY